MGRRQESNKSNVESVIISFFVIALLIWLVKSCVSWTFSLDENFDLDATLSLRECLTAIEERIWDNYIETFEPSAVIHPTSPNLSVHFVKASISIVQKSDETALVQLKTIIKVDGTDFQWPLDTQINMVKVNRPNFTGTLGLKKWYIAARDVSKLPFNFSY